MLFKKENANITERHRDIFQDIVSEETTYQVLQKMIKTRKDLFIKIGVSLLAIFFIFIGPPFGDSLWKYFLNGFLALIGILHILFLWLFSKLYFQPYSFDNNIVSDKHEFFKHIFLIAQEFYRKNTFPILANLDTFLMVVCSVLLMTKGLTGAIVVLIAHIYKAVLTSEIFKHVREVRQFVKEEES